MPATEKKQIEVINWYFVKDTKGNKTLMGDVETRKGVYEFKGFQLIKAEGDEIESSEFKFILPAHRGDKFFSK